VKMGEERAVELEFGSSHTIINAMALEICTIMTGAYHIFPLPRRSPTATNDRPNLHH